jgi:hypothetical protein
MGTIPLACSLCDHKFRQRLSSEAATAGRAAR